MDSRDSDAIELIEFIPFLLNQAAATAAQDFSRAFGMQYDLTGSECYVVLALADGTPKTATDICDQLNLHKTKVSRAATALEQKGLLHREVIEHDRRQSTLSISDAGRDLVNCLADKAKEYETKLLGNACARQRVELADALRRIARLTS